MCRGEGCVRRSVRKEPAAGKVELSARTSGEVYVDDDPALAEKDSTASDRPRFDGPEPVQPCQWYNGVHHVLVLASCIALFMRDGFFYSAPLAAFMLWYGDAYTAVLHCALDREACVSIKILTGAARGFQAHHEYPLGSTRDRGLYRMICDTQRIQLITIFSALLFGRWNVMTARLCLMKLVVSAYGGATGHFYAHCKGKARGPIVRALHRLHLLLPPLHHVGGHHKKPYDVNFGIVNGLSNAALNPILRCPSLRGVLTAWAFLSLFDVAIIERCVEPVGGMGAAVLDAARGFVVNWAA